VRFLAALKGAAEGLAAATLLLLIGWPARGSMGSAAAAAAGLALAGAAVRWLLAGRDLQRAAYLIEKGTPCLNLLVTAAELIDTPEKTRAAIGAVVLHDAARLTSRLDLPSLFPMVRSAGVFAVAIVLSALTVGLVARRPLTPAAPTVIPADAVGLTRVDLRVQPPAYAGRTEQVLRDPSRVEALAGSRIQITVSAAAASVALETIGGRQLLTPSGTGTFTGALTADADGFIAVEPAASDGQPGVRRLIGLGVTADRPPRVRVTTPGRDLYFADANRTIDVAVEADDDLALDSLRLRFTKVAGSGENFTFTDGEAPLAIARDSDRTWKARGSLKLDTLELAAGDMVVYRGVATDRRPGTTPVESDTFIVEILAPGAVAAEGFAMDDQRDRYAISQQMVILKTERLLARKSSTPAATFADEAAGLAAEQRQVRAEFVFMMGGELAEELIDTSPLTELNEEAEAAGEADLAAGLLANQGRADLIRAIRSMSRASTSLNGSEVERALKEERQALVYLQRAFTRARFILRALTERERLDLSRRLTGALDATARDARPAVEAAATPKVIDLRRALASVAELAAGRGPTRERAARSAALAQSILTVDPANDRLQQVAKSLGTAAGAIASGQDGIARAQFDQAANTLAAVVRAELPAAPSAAVAADRGRLEGAIADALRLRGPSR
jgi:hypothetical protein